jgi:hypothetical protein
VFESYSHLPADDSPGGLFINIKFAAGPFGGPGLAAGLIAGASSAYAYGPGYGYYGGPAYGYYGGYAPAYYGGYAPAYYNYGYAPAYYGGGYAGYYGPRYWRVVVHPAYGYGYRGW